ncbi:CRISPR-associated endonuclease Cas2 [Deinococcus aquiradiocola]|uniref:CRISPR-associated endoribonuclease Cas2 n=1 Tax=Deinococcus aquiradiocola TaxID=393059 RepID=A0A917PHM6_9DEIO|nr:CRISPR-associated endonuclease Cas2 [Deinococcus aquiradiocola]GGJ78820.1 hypothetical protein GCM10008939_23360 [Deinococcus aquiradiocola]
MLTLYVVSYDSPCPRRRRQLAALLSRRGRRVQRSVFELLLDAAALARCLRAVERLIAPEDSVLVYAATGSRHALGGAPEVLRRSAVTVI